jgi:uncharacterized protein (TIGR00369 family)
VPLSDEEQERRRAAMREVMVGTPYMSSLGLQVEEWSTDGVRIRLPFDERFTNDGAILHGGVVASLIDSAGAAAVWAGHDFDNGVRAATVSMTVNFIGAGNRADLIAEAMCVKRGRDLSFAEIHVANDGGKPVASATLVYRIVR